MCPAEACDGVKLLKDGQRPLPPETGFVYPRFRIAVIDGTAEVPAGSAQAEDALTQRNARRARVLAAARALLAHEGFDGVRLNRVAEISGVAMQTIYNLAGGKDHLIFLAVSEYYLAHTCAAHDEAARSGRPAIVCNIEMNTRVKEFYENYTRSIMEAIAAGKCGGQMYQAVSEMLVRGYTGSFRRMQQLGMLRDDANIPRLSSYLADMSISACLLWAIGHRSKDKLHESFIHGVQVALDKAIPEPQLPAFRRWLQSFEPSD